MKRPIIAAGSALCALTVACKKENGGTVPEKLTGTKWVSANTETFATLTFNAKQCHLKVIDTNDKGIAERDFEYTYKKPDLQLKAVDNNREVIKAHGSASGRRPIFIFDHRPDHPPGSNWLGTGGHRRRKKKRSGHARHGSAQVVNVSPAFCVLFHRQDAAHPNYDITDCGMTLYGGCGHKKSEIRTIGCRIPDMIVTALRVSRSARYMPRA